MEEVLDKPKYPDTHKLIRCQDLYEVPNKIVIAIIG